MSRADRLEEAVADLDRLADQLAADPRFAVESALRQHLGGALPSWLTGARRERIASLLPDLTEEAPLPGEAFGLVASNDGRAQLVRLRVSLAAVPDRQRLTRPSALSAEAVDAIEHAAFEAVRQYPHPFSLDPARQLEVRVLDLWGRPLDVPSPIQGGSLAAAAAVAVWSALTGRPASPRPYTGTLSRIAPGRLVGVSEIASKSREAASGGLTLVLPAGQASHAQPGAPVEEAGSLQEVLGRAFGEGWNDPRRCPPPSGYDPLRALEVLDAVYREGGHGLDWSDVAARFEALAARPELPAESRIHALARAGACWTHEDDPRSIERIQEALRLLHAEPAELISGQVEVLTHTHHAVALRDRFELEAALAEATHASELARRLRLPVDEANALSTLGQIHAAAGRLEAGLDGVRAGRDFHCSRHSFECPRNHTYVVDVLGRLGRLDEAAEEHRAGVAHNDARAPVDARTGNRAYLDYALLRGRLQALRRGRPHVDAAAFASDAEAALARADAGDLWEGWPRVGLTYLVDAARVRQLGAPELEDLLEATRARVRGRDHRLIAWLDSRVLADGALALVALGEEAAARRWAETWTELVPAAARPLFAQHLASIGRARDGEALAAAVLSLLEAEAY